MRNYTVKKAVAKKLLNVNTMHPNLYCILYLLVVYNMIGYIYCS